ncbi:hypothetical protein SNOG_15607 [Parastagonospora nodorum SN15]|uniref:Uncharacterized protein n=1 Tax=Phaeosphaeria nodorum (strain SN15 / ATCC MYA-4574 / FGSC 10173) TaxID=321614 RepID=Q0TXX9_PHANO|nr:hypothetical protein SNOG_15607 [Parastagonospora nodorum SN15]EAT76982.2 hypothetical protein SNOG_15607 [Parastagonospora nodorum SN15]
MLGSISEFTSLLKLLCCVTCEDNEDGEKVQALAGIMGDALPGAIAAINHADEMKADTEILDLPLAIKYFLEWSSDLPEYGMECNKGVLGAKELLEKAKSSGESKLRKKTGKDPWGWAKRLNWITANAMSPTLGGTHYNITNMSRKTRASHAFDKKDPSADMSDKDLKDGNLDFAQRTRSVLLISVCRKYSASVCSYFATIYQS